MAPWTATRRCTEFGPACPQPVSGATVGITSEDCLYLNFAGTGDPNGKGLLPWPVYDVQSGQNIEFGDAIRVNQHLLKKECDLIHQVKPN